LSAGLETPAARRAERFVAGDVSRFYTQRTRDIGLAAALVVGRVLQSFLVQTSTHDPITMLSIVVLLTSWRSRRVSDRRAAPRGSIRSRRSVTIDEPASRASPP
jgi:hypothetical protein